MIDVADTTIDLVALALGLGVAVFAFQIRNKFRGGMMWKPWRIIGPSPLLFSISQAIHVLQELYGQLAVLEILHAVSLFGFMLLLFYGFYLFNKVWSTKSE